MTEGTLFDLIQHLDEIEAGGGALPLVLYAEKGVHAGQDSRAVICERGQSLRPFCPLDASLSEVLSFREARETLEVWSSWRGGQTPSPFERFAAVMHFARYGVHLPAEPEREGM